MKKDKTYTLHCQWKDPESDQIVYREFRHMKIARIIKDFKNKEAIIEFEEVNLNNDFW